jgi:hypothetical protein
MTSGKRQQGVFHQPLRAKDTATQTEGCRATNPDICARHSQPKVCAFVRADGICLKPSTAWAKQYAHLKKLSTGNIL